MTHSQRFEASGRSVGAARRFVADVVADAPADIQESVALMVSELATNALVHAASGFEVAVDRSDFAVLVSVSDRGDGGMPHLRAPSSSQPHGRGLRIVDALSEEWGVVTTRDEGKLVWFRVGLRPPATGASGLGDADTPDSRGPELVGRSQASIGAAMGTGAALPDGSKNRGGSLAPNEGDRNRSTQVLGMWMVNGA